MLTIDLSGVDNIISMCDEVAKEMPEINAEFLKKEWEEFLKILLPTVPVGKTGNLKKSMKMSEIRQGDFFTEADWKAIEEYAGHVNYGTVYIAPRYFWETALIHLMGAGEKKYSKRGTHIRIGKNSADRYEIMLETIINSKLKAV